MTFWACTFGKKGFNPSSPKVDCPPTWVVVLLQLFIKDSYESILALCNLAPLLDSSPDMVWAGHMANWCRTISALFCHWRPVVCPHSLSYLFSLHLQPFLIRPSVSKHTQQCWKHDQNKRELGNQTEYYGDCQWLLHGGPLTNSQGEG